MSFSKLFSILLFSLLVACDTQELLPENNGEGSPGEKEIPISATETKELSFSPPASPLTPDPIPPSLPLPKPVEQIVPLVTEPKTSAMQVQFSEDLLKAVSNWTRIPKTVFPLKNVCIEKDVVFKLLSSQNEVIASSPFSAGREVVARGVRGTTLLISPSLDSKLSATIEMDKTDFKLGVAYRFEIGKKLIKLKEERRKMALLAKQNISENKLGVEEVKETNEKISDEFLIPGDFGHGKFCICPDCRQKRLAKFGSLK